MTKTRDKDVRKTFPVEVSFLFPKFLECTAEVECQLLKAAVISSVSQVCGLGVVSNGKKRDAVVEPGGEKCYSSKSSSLKRMASACAVR